MKNLLILVLVAVLVLSVAASPVSSAGRSVGITVANFKVTLNDIVMDNEYAAYPLIVYNQITYFPLTYYDCRFMGVTTGWNQSTQTLKIDATGVNEDYHATTQATRNPASALATVADYTVIINGKSINNATEQYPLLNFRDVTYFPMTWRFCVDEFGWDYHYTNETGLQIEGEKHEWDDGVVTKEASSSEDGIITYTCKDCGKTKTTIVPKYYKVTTCEELMYAEANPSVTTIAIEGNITLPKTDHGEQTFTKDLYIMDGFTLIITRHTDFKGNVTIKEGGKIVSINKDIRSAVNEQGGYLGAFVSIYQNLTIEKGGLLQVPWMSIDSFENDVTVINEGEIISESLGVWDPSGYYEERFSFEYHFKSYFPATLINKGVIQARDISIQGPSASFVQEEGSIASLDRIFLENGGMLCVNSSVLSHNKVDFETVIKAKGEGLILSSFIITVSNYYYDDDSIQAICSITGKSADFLTEVIWREVHCINGKYEVRN